MLQLALTIDENTSISVWKMEEDIAQVCQLINTESIDSFNKLSPKRQREKAFINLLLQQQLPGAEIGHLESGKPYLVNHPDTGISISHTGDYACLMLSKGNNKIGVDIEKNSTAKVLRVRHKFMHEEEIALRPSAEEGTDALLAWTTKEALFKFATPPHFDFIDGFRIKSYLFNENKGCSQVKDLINDNLYTVHHLICDDYVMSYCISNT